MKTKQKTHGMEPVRTSSLARALQLRRAVTTLLFCAAGVVVYLFALRPVLQCQESPRARIEAVGIALHFARDTFEGRAQNYRLGQLVELGETYDPEERTWHVLIASKDNLCQVEVAVRDCAWAKLGAGGECSEGVIEIPIQPRR